MPGLIPERIVNWTAKIPNHNFSKKSTEVQVNQAFYAKTCPGPTISLLILAMAAYGLLLH
jgi:hypothetical protein